MAIFSEIRRSLIFRKGLKILFSFVLSMDWPIFLKTNLKKKVLPIKQWLENVVHMYTLYMYPCHATYKSKSGLERFSWIFSIDHLWSTRPLLKLLAPWIWQFWEQPSGGGSLAGGKVWQNSLLTHLSPLFSPNLNTVSDLNWRVLNMNVKTTDTPILVILRTSICWWRGAKKGMIFENFWSFSPPPGTGFC